MKILVISDTHGDISKAVEVYKSLSSIDMVVHLGDCHSDAKRMEAELGIDIVSVKGNMDNCYDSNEYKIIKTEYGNLFLTHGHMQNVKLTLENIIYKSEETGCKAALFGHTHKPLFTQAGNLYLINPGSLTAPADSKNGSYAILNTSKEELTCSILYYQKSKESDTPLTPPASKTKNKIQGGFLRNLLNNSDRF